MAILNGPIDSRKEDSIISFQGRPCFSVEAVRSPGLDPDFATVEMPVSALDEITLEVTGKGYFAPKSGGGSDRSEGSGGSSSTIGHDFAAFASGESGASSSPTYVPIVGPFRIKGDLVIRYAGEQVTLGEMYLREDGIEQIDMEYESRPTVRVRLTDIRHFWNNFGELWGEFNTRRVDGSWEPTTIHPSGRPYNLREIIDYILGSLPGGVFIAMAAGSEEPLLGVKPANLRWMGLQPKEVLSDLLREHGFEFYLNLDGRTAAVLPVNQAADAALDNRQTRTLTDAFGKSVTVDAGRYDLRVSARYTFAPKAVRVRGGPIFRETLIPMIPVGVNRLNGRIEPIEDAAESFETTVDELARWVLLSPQDQETFFNGKFSATAREIREWAFRWFQVPPEYFPLLPIERYRVSTLRELDARDRTSDPTRLDDVLREPPLVVAPYFDVAVVQRVKDLQMIQELLHRAYLEHTAIMDDLKDLLEMGRRGESRVPGAPPITPAGVYDMMRQERFRYKQEVKRIMETTFKNEIVDLPFQDGVGRRRFNVERIDLRRPSVARDLQKAKKSLAKSLSKQAALAFVNMPPAPIDVVIDEARGIVKFPRPIGHLVDTKIKTLDMGEIAYKRGRLYVTMVCAFRDKPGIRLRRIGVEDQTRTPTDLARRRFTVLGGVDALGTPIILNLRMNSDGTVMDKPPAFFEPPDARALAARVVVREDMTLYVDIDGNSNIEALLGEARTLIKNELTRPERLAGAEVQAEGILPVSPSPLVRIVRWSMNENSALTTWSENTVPREAKIKQALLRLPRQGTRTREPDPNEEGTR